MLGYRKGEKGGTWYCRRRAGERYHIRQLAIADDHRDSDGREVADYFEAQALAREAAMEYGGGRRTRA